MIKYSQLDSLFATLPFECKEYNIEINEDETSLPLPYSAYFPSSFSPFSADGINYVSTCETRLLLIDGDFQNTYQSDIENLLTDNGLFYQKEIDFDEDSRVYLFTYNFEVINDYAEIGS